MFRDIMKMVFIFLNSWQILAIWLISFHFYFVILNSKILFICLEVNLFMFLIRWSL